MGSFIAMKQGLIIAEVKWTEFKRSKLIHKAEYGWCMIQLDSRTWRLSDFIFVFIDILMKLERCPDTLSWFLTVTFDCLSCDTIPLWGSRCPHFRLDWALAAHSIVTRQLCHTIVFGSSRTMTLERGVNTTVFGRGVSIQRQCWNLLTGSMIRRISKQRHFYHHCNEIIVPWNQCEFLKSQEKYKRQEDVEEEFSNPMLMSWSQKRQIARS